MSAFVNYHSRKLELPEGCKDLIDVLNLARAPEAKTFQGLGDVITYVSQFAASAAKFKGLGISCFGDADASLSVTCGKHGLRAFVLVDAGRTQAVRSIFADSGTSLLHDESFSNNGRMISCISYSLSSISGLDRFVRDLLTKGFSVTQDTDLLFHFHEKDAT